MTPPNNGGVIPIAEVDNVKPKIADNNVFTPTPADNPPNGVEPFN